jgi:hypothetical protein
MLNCASNLYIARVKYSADRIRLVPKSYDDFGMPLLCAAPGRISGGFQYPFPINAGPQLLRSKECKLETGFFNFQRRFYCSAGAGAIIAIICSNSFFQQA